MKYNTKKQQSASKDMTIVEKLITAKLVSAVSAGAAKVASTAQLTPRPRPRPERTPPPPAQSRGSSPMAARPAPLPPQEPLPITTSGVIRPMDPLRKAYGPRLSEVLDSARKYRAENQIEGINSLDQRVLNRPVPVSWHSDMPPHSKGQYGLTSKAIYMNENLFEDTPEGRRKAQQVKEHEALHATQTDLKTRLNSPSNSIVDYGDYPSNRFENYITTEHELQARLPRLNRMWVKQEGNEFPRSQEEASRILNHYGFVRPVEGQATKPPANMPNLPEDIQDLRDVYYEPKTKETKRQRLFDWMAKQLPGVVSSPKPTGFNNLPT